MRRAGFDRETRDSVKLAFRTLLRSGLGIEAAMEEADALDLKPEAAAFVEFFRNPSRKGICR